MANLRVDKITSTETFETTGSVQFDGTNDGLTVSDHADFDLGTGDFTIEGWYYLENFNTSTQCLMDWRGGDGISGACPVVFRDSSSDNIYYYLDGARRIDNIAISYDTWFHLTICRSSGKTRLFIDGVERGSFSDSFDYVSSDILLGLAQSNNSDIKGNISNYRVVKGKALYTSNFKPPMRELENIPGTVLLCCQSKTDTTLEKTSKTITVRGGAVASELTPGILTPVPKAGAGSAITGSVEFTGDPDHLTVGSASDWTFLHNGTTHTVECWFNSSEEGNAPITGLPLIVTAGTPSAVGFSLFISQGLNGNVRANFNKGSGDALIAQSPASLWKPHTWNHLAAVYDSSTSYLTVYLNGVNVVSTDGSSYAFSSADPTYTLAIARNQVSSPHYSKVFISNARIVKGTALYTDDFIPPTRELKKVPGTVLLCCQDSNDPTQEATGKTISLNGLFDTGDVVSSGITTTPVSSNFTPQVGDDRKVTFEGVTKINSDAYFYLPTGDTVTRDTRSGRGIVGGGESPSRTDAINFIQIQSTGNTQDFGDLTGAKSLLSACASSTRGIFGGGYLAPPSTYLNVMEFVTMASTGDALDFGDLSVDRQGPGSCSNSTRGVFAGGSDPGNLNTIDFVTIASTGDATDFGDLITKRAKHKGCGSSIRAIIFSPEPGEDIQFFNYASTGRATSFGEMTPDTKGDSGVASDSTRALRFGGNTHPAGDIGNNISYITISSTGDEQEFGDLSATGSVRGTAMSNSIRAVQILNNNGGNTNAMEYVTIQSTGNGKDFGDLTSTNLSHAGSTSDSHGGLG